MSNNKQIILLSRPIGKASDENFEIRVTQIPKVEQSGEIVARALLYSLDPYIRARMREGTEISYEINEPITNYLTAQVIESKNDKFKVGDLITGIMPFAEYFKLNEEQIAAGVVNQVHETLRSKQMPLSYSVSVLGMPGMTAWVGIVHFGKLKAGETVLVSAAAGAVGLMVGQIAKLHGCTVVGTAGTDDKVKLLKEKYGFDDAFNYKKISYLDGITQTCPKGVDVYFDNVGGEARDAALLKLNSFGRIVICGAISEYHNLGFTTGPNMTSLLLYKNGTMVGYTINLYHHLYPQALDDMSKWALEGKLSVEDTEYNGFDQILPAYYGLYAGDNTGKMIVKVADPDQ